MLQCGLRSSAGRAPRARWVPPVFLSLASHLAPLRQCHALMRRCAPLPPAARSAEQIKKGQEAGEQWVTVSAGRLVQLGLSSPHLNELFPSMGITLLLLSRVVQQSGASQRCLLPLQLQSKSVAMPRAEPRDGPLPAWRSCSAAPL